MSTLKSTYFGIDNKQVAAVKFDTICKHSVSTLCTECVFPSGRFVYGFYYRDAGRTRPVATADLIDGQTFQPTVYRATDSLFAAYLNSATQTR